MKMPEIHDDRAFYEAVHEYANKVWDWRAHVDDDYATEPTPDEFIAILEQRIEWVKEHKRIVDQYLRRRNRPTWFRVIDGSSVDPGS